MRLSTAEEYGLRCLMQVARRAPAGGEALASIREVADAEGLSQDYAAKLLGALKRSGLVEAERGAAGGFRLAVPSERLSVGEVLRALDTPLYHESFCASHTGNRECCVHRDADCSLTMLWRTVGAALDDVLGQITVGALLQQPSTVQAPQGGTHG